MIGLGHDPTLRHLTKLIPSYLCMADVVNLVSSVVLPAGGRDTLSSPPLHLLFLPRILPSIALVNPIDNVEPSALSLQAGRSWLAIIRQANGVGRPGIL